MEGVRILVHAVRMVLGNLNTVLRISGAWLVIMVVLGLMAGESYFETGIDRGTQMPSFEPVLFVLGFSKIIFGLWIAVAWHRYILLEERPGAFLPQWRGGAIWSYFKAGFVIVLIMILMIIPMSIVFGFVMVPIYGSGGNSLAAGLLFFLTLGLPAAYVFYRISPMLPSAAVGDRLPVKQAWAGTRSSGLAFISLTIVTVILGYVIQLPAQILASTALPVAVIWSAVAQWVSTVVGASIITTIYGHYVQKRELNA